MNQVIYDRIKELRCEKRLGADNISRLLAEEFPEEKISFQAWKSRIRRYFEKEGLGRLDLLPEKEKSTNTDTPITEITPNTSKPTPPQSVEYKADGSYIYNSIIEIFENEEVTPERIMQAHNLNSEEWEVVSYKNNYWSQQTKGGKPTVLYQSKLIVKPRKLDDISEEMVLKHFMTKAEQYKNKLIPNINSQNNTNSIGKLKSDNQKRLMLEINICDLHLGKLAFNSVSNDTYDYRIAKQRFLNLINSEYRRARELNVEKILFVWSNDFFNTDGISNATTKGTLQQTALSWQNLFLEGVSMLVDAIDLLSSVAPLKTFYIASNHSRQADFYALCYLSAWFKDNENVTVEINQRSRYYERYGVVLLGFSHSSYEKESNLYHVMSIECPEEWSDTTYREFHLAHYHSEKVKDVGGVIYRWLPTMCGTDDFHYDKGYIGSIKRSYSFVYDKFKGLVQMNCNIV